MCVTNVTDAVSIDAMKLPHHIVFRLNTAVEVDETWQGECLPRKLWTKGSTGFLPANTELSAKATTPYSESAIRLSDHWFREASVGDMDYSRMDLRYQEVSSTSLPEIATAVTSLATWPKDRPWPLMIESLTLALAATVAYALHGNTSKAQLKCGLSRERKRRVLEYIEANLSRQISLSELATVAALSQFHFARSFRLSFGISPLRYLLGRRVKAARIMLLKSNQPLVSVAILCGFASQSHFNTAFKLATGASPGQFRMAA